jgi:alpha-1,6-mannosyltransferase
VRYADANDTLHLSIHCFLPLASLYSGRIVNYQKSLVKLAIALSAIFCSELLLQGWMKYQAVFTADFKTVNFTDIFEALYVRRGVEYVALLIVYGVWLYRARSPLQNSNLRFSQLLRSTGIFLLFAFLAYPETTDIYQYLHYGVMGLNGVNPYVNSADSFTSALSPLLVWKQSSTYGLVSQVLFMVSAAFVAIAIPVSVYVFKGFCLVLHGASGYLIWRSLRLAPVQSWLTLAYLVNPVLLFELVGNAHVDVLLCLAIVSLVLLLRARCYGASSVAIWLGFLSKTIPIIWLPLLFAFLVRCKQRRAIAIGVGVSISIMLTLSLTVLPTPAAWIGLFNSGTAFQTAGSLHNIVGSVLESYRSLLPSLAGRSVRILLFGFRLLTYVGFALFYLKVMFKILFKVDYSENQLITDFAWITLVLFLFATPWYQPWYSVILIPFAVLVLDATLLKVSSLVFCGCSTCAYYLLAYTSETNLLLGVSLITVVPTLIILHSKIWSPNSN